MAIMSSQHWMQQTSRGVFTPRSAELKAIDNALRAYEQTGRTPPPLGVLVAPRGVPPELNALYNALIAWIRSKGDNWRTSTRNTNREVPGGKGTVETLLAQVFQAYPPFRDQAGRECPAAVPSFAPPAPPTGLEIPLGAWTRYRDEDGNHHEIPIQTEQMSCGPAAVRIVIKIVQNRDIGADLLCTYVADAEHPGATSLGGVGPVTDYGLHSWTTEGTLLTHIPAILGNIRPQIRHNLVRDIGPLLAVQKGHPAIALVQWLGPNTGHFVVAAQRNKLGDKLIILDPLYGLQYVSIAGCLAPYQPIDKSGSVRATASWYPGVVAIV